MEKEPDLTVKAEVTIKKPIVEQMVEEFLRKKGYKIVIGSLTIQGDGYDSDPRGGGGKFDGSIKVDLMIPLGDAPSAYNEDK